MGVLLEKSNLAQDLLSNMAEVIGGFRGSLAISVIFVGALSQEMQCAAPNKVSRVPRMRSAPGGVSNIGATP